MINNCENHRKDDHLTSIQAAHAERESQREQLVGAYRKLGETTPDRAANEVGLWPHANYWKRVGEMEKEGTLIRTGNVAMGLSGRKRNTHRLADDA